MSGPFAASPALLSPPLPVKAKLPYAGKEIIVKLPKLHAGQVKIREQIKAAHARFVVVMCGRQFGKTTDGVEWIADGALSGEPCAWMAPTYKYLGEAWREIVERLRPAAAQISEQDHRIVLHGGGSIECWTLDSPDPGRGRHYKRIVLDEAGLVRDVKRIFDSALRPTLIRLAGDARFYGTPKGRTHGFVQLFAKGESGDLGWLSVRARTADNPYIPREEIESARRDMSPEMFAQEFEGIPTDDSANPFGQTAVLACLAPISGLAPVCWGWDFARAQDWTVGIALDEAGHVCRMERWQHKPWGDTRDLVTRYTQRTVAVGDSTGVGDAVVESIQAKGVPMEGYSFTPKSKQQLMERLAGAIQAQEIRFPDGVIRLELETFEYEYVASGVRYSAPDGLHDDAVMAIALALYAYDTYGFGVAYRRKQLVTPVIETPRGVSLGYDYEKHRPRERLTAEQEVDKMFRSANGFSPLAGRAGMRLPRGLHA